MIAAAIFDLDGTMVNNNPFHIKAWQAFYEQLGRSITEQEYKQHINGKTNADVLKYVFEQQELSQAEIDGYTQDKEAIYRTMYAPYIEPVPGLIKLLENLYNQGIPIAMATSGIPVNIDFFFEHIPIRHLFTEVVNSTHITHGKPHPEIYQTTAKKLGVPPELCVAFEDAVPGVRSAKTAGCKVVGITTTHTQEELFEADAHAPSFEIITPTYLARLLQQTT